MSIAKLPVHPLVPKTIQVAKFLWKHRLEIVGVVCAIAIAEDVDAARDATEASLSLDYITAVTNGVI